MEPFKTEMPCAVRAESVRLWKSSLMVAGLLLGSIGYASAAIELTDVTNGNGTGFYITGEPTIGPGLYGDAIGAATLGIGDVNGDGFADVMATCIAYTYTFGSGADDFRSAVAVIFGNSDKTHLELTDIAQGDGGFLIKGIQYQSDFTSLVGSAGDFNGDGLDDIIVGGGFHITSPSSPLRVSIVFGKADGGVVDLSTATSGVFTIQGAFISNFGKSVSGAGDVNGDGLGDVVALGDNQAYVFFGRNASGKETIGNALSAGGFRIVDRDSRLAILDSVAGAGDVNGDGLDDLLVRTVKTTSTSGLRGRCAVVFGKASSSTVDVVDLEAGLGGGFVIVDSSYNSLGRCLATAGDINGDGLSDFCLSAPTVNIVGPPAIKDIWYVVYGKAGTVPVYSSELDLGIRGFSIRNDYPDDYRFPISRGLGDINQDGLGDLSIGGPTPVQTLGSPGKLSVLFGKTDTQAVLISQIQNEIGGIAVQSVSPLEWIGWGHGSAGDVDGNGTTDFMVGGPRSYVQSGAAFVLFTDQSEFASSQYTTHCKSGVVPMRGVGVLGDGTQYPPDSNAWIGFDAGTGPGVDGASSVTIEIIRSDQGISNLGNGTLLDVPNVMWHVESDRTAWSQATVEFRVTEEQLAGLDIDSLTAYTAVSPAGPWIPLVTSANSSKNIATASSSSLGYFAFAADLNPLSVTVTQEATASDNDYAEWRFEFSDKVTPTFKVDDIATTSTIPLEFILVDSDPVYRLFALFNDPDADGTIEWELDGSIVGRFGNGLTVPTTRHSRLVKNFSAGDINKDGVVDLLDVSMLADYNLGIATLP